MKVSSRDLNERRRLAEQQRGDSVSGQGPSTEEETCTRRECGRLGFGGIPIT